MVVSDEQTRSVSGLDHARSITLPAKVIVSLRAGAILALANIICVGILAWAYTHVKGEIKVISVTGSAKKQIRSDLIVWRAKVFVNNPSLTSGYDDLKAATDKTMAYLRDHGVAEKEISISAISSKKNFVFDGYGHATEKISSFDLEQTVQISSGDIDRVTEVAANVTALMKDGVMLESQVPEYIYTKLADLKVEMLAEATKDARVRAVQIASNSGANLGSIREARMGVMQINPIHSNSTSDTGNNDTTALEKEITAIVSARFELD